MNMRLLLLMFLILLSCKTEPERRNPVTVPVYSTVPPPYNPKEAKEYEDAMMRKAGAVEPTPTKKYVFVKATVDDGRCFASEIMEYTDLSEEQKAKLLDKAENILTDGSFGASSVRERDLIISESYKAASEKLHKIENRGKFRINQF